MLKKKKIKLISTKTNLSKKRTNLKATKSSKVKAKVNEKKEFEKYLERVEDPKNNQEVNYDLPEKPTPLQVAKFDICQNILAYQQDNNVTDEELAKRMNLSIPEMEEILFAQIDKFTLDRLMTYANCLFAPAQVKITITKLPLRTRKGNSLHAR